MLSFNRILVTTIILAASAVGLTACGQQGALYLPTDPAAGKRATLPETLWRSGAALAAPTDAPATPAKPASPASTPVTQ